MNKEIPLGTVLIQNAPKIIVGKKSHLLERAKETILEEIKKGTLKPKLFTNGQGILPFSKDFMESNDFDNCFSDSDGWTFYSDDPSTQMTDVSEYSVAANLRSLFDENKTLYKQVDGKVVIESSQLQNLRKSLKEDFEYDELIDPQITYYENLGVNQKKWVDEAKGYVAGLSSDKREELTRKNSGINQTNIAKWIKKYMFEAQSKDTIRDVLNKTSNLWQ